MKPLSNPTIDRNDLVSFISKSQEYMEVLTNIISLEELQDINSSKVHQASRKELSPEDVQKLEDKVSQLIINYENDSTIIIKFPGRKPVEYNYRQLGFRSNETKTWKMLTDILSSSPYTFDFGVAYTYPDGSKTNRYKNKAYDSKWKLMDELNKKLLVFFEKEFAWKFPQGYKLYEHAKTGNNGERQFKFIVQPPSSEDREASFPDIENSFLSLDETELIKSIGQLYNDFSVDSCVHNEEPEVLIAAFNVGRDKFGWDDKKIMAIMKY